MKEVKSNLWHLFRVKAGSRTNGAGCEALPGQSHAGLAARAALGAAALEVDQQALHPH